MDPVVTLPHIRLVFGGSFFGTETWQAGLHLSAGGMSPSALSSFCEEHIDDVRDDIKTWALRPAAGLSSAASLDWVKMNGIGTDNLYSDPDHVHQSLVMPGVVNPGSTISPTDFTAPQLALCVSLRSGIAGSRASHGRLFLPVQGYAPDFTGHVSDAACTEVCAAFVNLLTALNDWPGVDPPSAPHVCLVTPDSPARAATETKPARPFRAARMMPVTAVWVGNVLDTQRRRRKDIGETYVKFPL